MHSIPNEIQDRILDFLHDSKPALKACALVCKAWLPTSRYHLAPVIRLTPNRVDYIMKIFKNPNCTIRSCTELFVRNWDIGRRVKITEALQHLSTHLKPSSLILEIQGVTHEMQSALVQFQSVERLVLTNMREFNRVLLLLFPNIHQLHIEECELITPHTGNFQPLQLHSLEFTHCRMDPLLRYFIDGSIVPTGLLSIKLILKDDASIVGEYFTMFGNVLQEVRIGFYEPGYIEPFCSHANLQCLTSLRSLIINFVFYEPPVHMGDHINVLVPILDNVRSSTLTKLCLELWTPPIGDHRFTDLHRIEKVLQQSRFSQLTELVFLFQPQGRAGHPVERVEQWIREDLSALKERGISISIGLHTPRTPE